MDAISLKVSAKINLSLDVVGERTDGYHNIESIFQSVGLYDEIAVKRLSERKIILKCDEPGVPCDKTNTAFIAAELFFKKTGIIGGAEISVKKNIPSQAGLGGGSADGAGVLYALNKLFKAGLDGKKLTRLGAKVSADTAFFTVGGTAFVSGIGDVIHSIRYIPKTNIVIAKGSSGISTPEAYKKIDSLGTIQHSDTQKLLKYIDEGKFLKKCSLCRNVFEDTADLPDVTRIKQIMLSRDALTALMSGSGSAVFGIFPTAESAERCVGTLKRDYPFAVCCTTVPESIIPFESE